jgi:hypothetical protein
MNFLTLRRVYLPFILIYLVTAGSLTGCTTTDITPINERALQATYVTMKSPNHDIPTSGQFAWEVAHSRVFADTKVADSGIEQMIRQSIVDTLNEKRFYLTNDQPDITIGFVAALESALSHEAINQIYGIDPGWIPKGHDNHFETGTIIIDVFNPQRQIIWRGAIQGDTNLTLDSHTRQKRIEAAIHNLMSSFP